MVEYDPPLDEGIRAAVELLCKHGIETYESCEGGEGHTYPEPAVRFFGESSEGFKAVAIALQHALPVSYIRRFWSIQNGEPVGPQWEMTFWKKIDYDSQKASIEFQCCRECTLHGCPELIPGYFDAATGKLVT